MFLVKPPESLIAFKQFNATQWGVLAFAVDENFVRYDKCNISTRNKSRWTYVIFSQMKKKRKKTFFFKIIDTLKRPATSEILALPMPLLVVTLCLSLKDGRNFTPGLIMYHLNVGLQFIILQSSRAFYKKGEIMKYNEKILQTYLWRRYSL